MTARILVTDARRGSALAIIRSLGRAGHTVIAADAPGISPGLRSRHATSRVRYPAPAATPDRAADAILAAAVRHRVQLIIPVTDEVILPLLARHRPDVHPPLAVASGDALETAWDKAATLRLARTLGVPVPATIEARRADDPDAILAAADGLGWPVVVKPARSRVYRPGRPLVARAVALATTPAELREVLDGFEDDETVLIQERVAGTGEGVELLVDRGTPVLAFQHRRLREVPARGGASAYRESVALEPRLLDLACRLVEALRWTGLAMVEFKVGADGPRLMEINGRVWGSLPLATAAGVDFPLAMARLHLGPAGPAAPPRRREGFGRYRVGLRAHHLGLEAAWIGRALLRRHDGGAGPGRRAGLAALASLARPGDRIDSLAADDPLPFLIDVLALASRVGAPR